MDDMERSLILFWALQIPLGYLAYNAPRSRVKSQILWYLGYIGICFPLGVVAWVSSELTFAFFCLSFIGMPVLLHAIGHYQRRLSSVEKRVSEIERIMYIPSHASTNLSDDHQSYVYLAWADTGHYKIGISNKPYKRIRHFKTKMPVDVLPVHFIATSQPRILETQLHRMYANQRVNGEWFVLEPEQVDFICSIEVEK